MLRIKSFIFGGVQAEGGGGWIGGHEKPIKMGIP